MSQALSRAVSKALGRPVGAMEASRRGDAPPPPVEDGKELLDPAGEIYLDRLGRSLVTYYFT